VGAECVGGGEHVNKMENKCWFKFPKKQRLQ
jgi:hypothetical protein